MKNYSNLDLKRDIMIRVRFVHLAMKLKEPLFIKLGLFAMLLVAFIFSVSVPNVVDNVMTSLKGEGNVIFFFSSAFSETLLLVKVVIIAEILLLLTFLRDALARLSPLKHRTA